MLFQRNNDHPHRNSCFWQSKWHIQKVYFQALLKEDSPVVWISFNATPFKQLMLRGFSVSK